MPFRKRRDKPLEVRLLDQRNRLPRLDPLRDPLSELGPGRALSLYQQGIDLHFAGRLNARFVKHLLVGEDPHSLAADLPPDARLFEGFAGG